jgi:hypothetical protein
MISRPWKHPKTGVYYFRLSIPEDLRPFAKGGRNLALLIRKPFPRDPAS